MTKEQNETVICQICKEEKDSGDVMPAEMVRGAIVDLIRKKYPNWSPKGFICLSDLRSFRSEYVQNILEEEKGELSTLEMEVMKSMEAEELLSKNLNVEFDSKLTIGQHIADNIAEFGGSWRFIIIFLTFIGLWILTNVIALLGHFDPFPFILLNLILSCIAAIQAPVIMMSQNRQESKDRLRAEHDYRVNLKAELEVRHLNEKMDHLLIHQWQRFMEMQQIQIDLIEELTQKKTPNNMENKKSGEV
jgi:uncharacterized membrane protein